MDHNLIYRNTGDGVLVSGARNVDISSNTIVVDGDFGIRLEERISDIAIRNNIIMTAAGFGVWVEPDAQVDADGGNRYSSNFNNFSGGGVLFRGKGFFDVYDVQVEVGHDLDSIGSTALDPTRDDTMFVDLANDDYHLLPGSTSIDAGDPALPFALEPVLNGNRVYLGAYANTPQATRSPTRRLEIVELNFYQDVIPSRTGEISWETNNIAARVDLDIDLITAVGNNRNVGITANAPKVVPRALIVSYSMGPGDEVRIDTGNHVFAATLNLSADPLDFDPQVDRVSDTQKRSQTSFSPAESLSAGHACCAGPPHRSANRGIRTRHRTSCRGCYVPHTHLRGHRSFGMKRLFRTPLILFWRITSVSHVPSTLSSTWAIARGANVPIVAAVNKHHYRGDEPMRRALADVQRMKTLGVRSFQIDSVYDRWFIE